MKRGGIKKWAAGGAICIAVIVAGITAFLMTKAIKMNQMIEQEVAALQSSAAKASPARYDQADFDGLPDPVQRYFRYALPHDRQLIKWIAYQSSGKFKLPFSDKRFDVTANEYLSAETPGLIFDATFKHCPFFGSWAHVRDKYASQRGNMYGNLFSGFTIIDEHNVEELNQDMFLRFVGNLALMPTALLPCKNLRWQPLDSHSAKLVVADGGNSGSAVVRFNDLGQIVRWETDGRYDKLRGQYRKVKHVGHRSNYRDISGFKIPMDFSVEKILPDGTREVFWQGSISNIRFNEPKSQ